MGQAPSCQARAGLACGGVEEGAWSRFSLCGRAGRRVGDVTVCRGLCVGDVTARACRGHRLGPPRADADAAPAPAPAPAAAAPLWYMQRLYRARAGPADPPAGRAAPPPPPPPLPL